MAETATKALSKADQVAAILAQNGIDADDPEAVAAYFNPATQAAAKPPKLNKNDIYNCGSYVLDFLPGGPKTSDPEVQKANAEVKKVNKHWFVAQCPGKFRFNGETQEKIGDGYWEVWILGDKDACNGYVEVRVGHVGHKARVDGSVAQRQIRVPGGEKLDMAALKKAVESFGK